MKIVDILFIACLFFLYFIPKKSKKYKFYCLIPLFIFLLNMGIRVYLINQKYRSAERIAFIERKVDVWELSEE